ncbi:hypothetical protein A9Q99_05165 [Gammaproteobacteria bacterium 45_16_T64]|nr:hypothetical protein A9Q99_05165 [Gammaproteobacteria bacterium 45_16_T64]
MRRVVTQVIIMLWLVTTTSASTVADSFTDRRISVGQKLFRTMLVADMNYRNSILPDGNIYVDMVYQYDEALALRSAEMLTQDLSVLHEVPVVIRTISIKQYLARGGQPSVGVFISEKLSSEQLKKVIKRSIANQHILFSPFEGDVEKGVMAGLSVESRVRPFVNMRSLELSKVKVKPFFIKVSKRYAP